MKVVSISNAQGGPAAQSFLLQKALNKLGFEAVDVSFKTNYILYPSTFCLETAKPSEVKRARRAIEEADFFVIHNYDPRLLGRFRQSNPKLVLGGGVHRSLAKNPITIELTPKNHVIKLHGSDAVAWAPYLKLHYERHATTFVGSPDVRIWREVPGVHWIPPMMDAYEMANIMGGMQVERPKEWRGKIIVNHAATDRSKKGTGLLADAIGLLREAGVEAVADISTNLTWKFSLLRKRGCDIYFDQVFAGFYGVSAVEALLLGKPVLVGLSGWTESWLEHFYAPPFYRVSTAEDIVKAVEFLKSKSEKTLKDMAMKRVEWAHRVHGLDRVGRQWKSVIEEVSKR